MVTQATSGAVDASEADHPSADPTSHTPRRNIAIVVGLCVGLLGLTWAWAFATPMNGFPDDADHYLRSVGVAEGQVLGEPNPVLEGAEVPTTKGCCVGPNPAAEYWVQAGLRKVTVPGDVRPELIDCASAADRAHFGCGAAAPLEAASYDTLALEHPADHVLLVRMNRPAVSNAMNTQMGLDLMHAFEAIVLDSAGRSEFGALQRSLGGRHRS